MKTDVFTSIRRLGVGIGLTAISTAAMADHLYVAGSFGITDHDSTSNDGTLTSAFTTGTVTGVNPPLNIPSGAGVSWKTDYDTGDFASLALGWDMEPLRLELEYSRGHGEVDTHKGVSAAGLDLSSIDAGVLITGNVGDLGVSVADLVADGQGEIETIATMLNAIYDIDLNSNWTPYIGAGIGRIETDLSFSPSGVSVLSDSDENFSYQLLAGISYDFNDAVSFYLNYRYMDGGEASLDATLLPASFDIENKSQTFDLGIRFSF